MKKTATGAIVALAIVGMSYCAHSSPQSHSPVVELVRALPIPADLPAFRSTGANQHALEDKLTAPGKAPISAVTAGTLWTRSGDDLLMMIDTYVAATRAEAQKLAHRTIRGQAGSLPKGSPSGRKIGEAVWSPNPNGSTLPRGPFILAVLDGRTVITIKLFYSAVEGLDGRPYIRDVSPRDVGLAESVAIQILDRATALGCTSRPPASASTEARLRTGVSKS